MVGTASESQLTAGVRPPRGVRFARATNADDAAIRRLLRDNPMRGAISLTFEREPGYFQGADLAGATDQTILAFEAGRLICMGRCTTRDGWLNGRVARIAYLGELRLDRTAQGRFDVLRGGYRFFQAQRPSPKPDYTFTSLAADNQRARRLLERGLPGLPRYEFLAELTTLVISTGHAPHPGPPLESATAEELAAFFNATASQHQLAAAWSPPAILALAQHGLPLDGFGVWRQHGRIVAAAACWDQRGFRQTVIRGYSRPLALARPVLQYLGPALGLPRLPAPDSVLCQAFLSPLALAPDYAVRLPEFVAAFACRAAAKGIEFLTLALPSTDLRFPALNKIFRPRRYESRLYRVFWPEDAAVTLDARTVLPDVSLL